jgi:putative ABC transport system permease protein
VITPNYFRAMGMSLLAGRDFTDADSHDATKVTIIDERLAQEYWPGESPLGKRIRFGPPEDNEPWHTIVGVVGAVRHERLDAVTRMSIYVPHQQIPVRGMTLAVRAASQPENLVAAVRNQVWELDRDQPVNNVRTMNEVISRSVWQQRLYTILFGAFAGVALLLACVGIYGVMAYSVTQRTHEIGIRMALGAQTSDVLRMVVGQGMLLAVIGVAIGLVGAVALTRVMSSLLFNVSATDPQTFVAVSLLLTGVALLACYIPARRATRVDPMVALRYE